MEKKAEFLKRHLKLFTSTWHEKMWNVYNNFKQKLFPWHEWEWVKQQKDTQIYLTSKVVCLLEIQFHILETFTFNFMVAAIHRIKFWW